MLLFSRFGVIAVLVVGIAFVSLALGQEVHYGEEYEYDEMEVSAATLPADSFRYIPAPVESPVRTHQNYYHNLHTPDPNYVVVNGAYIHGKEIQSAWNGKSFRAFLGIKYGSVGSGLERFQAARPPPPPGRIIEATSEPIACPSFTNLTQIEDAERRGINVDDCLTLSVFTPRFYSSLPVMVYVHGEMLFDGSAEEAKPDYLLEKDIVLVSVNYRLAPFGFLSTQTDDIPGNIALSDLELALEWIQKNIDSFGGNASSVTLFGQAGGATLIHALSLSERVNHFNFNRLILQSGTALNPLFIDEDPLSTARAIGREARCPYISTHSPYELSLCLGQLNTSQLLKAFLDHCNYNEDRGLYSYGGFKLSVGDKHGYIPRHPALMLNSFKFPVVAGLAKDAGGFFLTRIYDELMHLKSHNISDYIDVVLKHTTLPKHYSIWKKWALDYIFDPEDIQVPVLRKIASGLLELTNLILYKAPIMESVKFTWQSNATYLYSFDYRGLYHRFPKSRTHFPYELDASLSDDNIYLFPFPEQVNRLNSKDRSVAELMVTMWTNFATFENPDPRSWPRMSNDFGPFVRIKRSLELDYHFGDGIASPDLYSEMRKAMNATTRLVIGLNKLKKLN